MSLRKRGKCYHIDIISPSGTRVRRSTGIGDIKLAQEYHDTLKADLWKQTHLKEKPKKSWDEAALRWLKEKAHKKSLHTDKVRIRWLTIQLRGVYLNDITNEVVESLADKKLSEDVSNATVNRMLQVLRSILNCAKKEWLWIDNVPFIRLLREENARVRWLEREESYRLIQELPSHLVAIVRFALSTGLRQGNIKNLKWSNVNLEDGTARVNAEDSKTGQAIGIPLNAEAKAVLREEIGKHHEYVFTYKGSPINQVNTKAWKKALNRCGISNFRFHDLRHTWASWHVQSGTPLYILKELGGWKTMDMVMRYAHLAPEQLREHAERLCEIRAVG